MSSITLNGSCLCGAVTYEAEGEIVRFVHCHCRRCRKATATGHATNLFLELRRFEWLTGESHLRQYKVPDAKRFATNFCGTCGSLMPRVVSDGKFAVIPAGSLDTDPGALPDARIFIGSRATWSCDTRMLTEYEEYSPP